jgi:hypothetical protein
MLLACGIGAVGFDYLTIAGNIERLYHNASVLGSVEFHKEVPPFI